MKPAVRTCGRKRTTVACDPCFVNENPPQRRGAADVPRLAGRAQTVRTVACRPLDAVERLPGPAGLSYTPPGRRLAGAAQAVPSLAPALIDAAQRGLSDRYNVSLHVPPVAQSRSRDRAVKVQDGRRSAASRVHGDLDLNALATAMKEQRPPRTILRSERRLQLGGGVRWRCYRSNHSEPRMSRRGSCSQDAAERSLFSSLKPEQTLGGSVQAVRSRSRTSLTGSTLRAVYPGGTATFAVSASSSPGTQKSVADV